MKNPLFPFQGLNLHPGFYSQQRVFRRFEEKELLLLDLAGHELGQERSAVPGVTFPFDQGYGFVGPALPTLKGGIYACRAATDDYDVHKTSLLVAGY
jgi:hypothetical protein